MGVVANNGIRARQRNSQGRAARLVREHERQSPEVIQRRARIQVATRTGRAAIKARSQAEERLVTSHAHARDLQIAISDVLEEHLKHIDWGSDGHAKRLHLRNFPASADVIIDPRFGWGAPVLGQSKVRVEDLVSLWRNGERLSAIADEYALTVDAVEDVLRRAA